MDENYLHRASPAFKRVTEAMSDQMAREGFWVVDEEMLELKTGWDTGADRRTSKAVKSLALDAADLDNPSIRPRAVTTMRVRAQPVRHDSSTEYSTEIHVRVNGNVYDAEAGRQVGSYEAEDTINARADCNRECLMEEVGDEAREIGRKVADTLNRKLAFASRGGVNQSAAGAGQNGQSSLTSTYNVTFKNFETSEVMKITDVMENEFPDYVRSRAPKGDTTKMVYGYVSKAPAHKIYEWMNILLTDMGLNPDDQVKVTVDNTKLVLNKLYDEETNDDGSQRFN